MIIIWGIVRILAIAKAVKVTCIVFVYFSHILSFSAKAKMWQNQQSTHSYPHFLHICHVWYCFFVCVHVASRTECWCCGVADVAQWHVRHWLVLAVWCDGRDERRGCHHCDNYHWYRLVGKGDKKLLCLLLYLPVAIECYSTWKLYMIVSISSHWTTKYGFLLST